MAGPPVSAFRLRIGSQDRKDDIERVELPVPLLADPVSDPRTKQRLLLTLVFVAADSCLLVIGVFCGVIGWVCGKGWCG
jgi:hypothetical protein